MNFQHRSKILFTHENTKITYSMQCRMIIVAYEVSKDFVMTQRRLICNNALDV